MAPASSQLRHLGAQSATPPDKDRCTSTAVNQGGSLVPKQGSQVQLTSKQGREGPNKTQQFLVVGLLALGLVTLPLSLLAPFLSPTPARSVITMATSLPAGIVRTLSASNLQPGSSRAHGQGFWLWRKAEQQPGSGGNPRLGRAVSIESEVKALSANLVQLTTLPATVARIAGERRLVILTVTSQPYISLTRNWLYSVEALGYASHVLIMALDLVAYSDLSAEWPLQVLLLGNHSPSNESSEQETVGSEAAAGDCPGSPSRRLLLSGTKSSILLALLELKVSVFFNDPDTTWLQDPLPFLNTPSDVLLSEEATSFQGVLQRFPDGKPGVPHPSTGEESSHQVSDSLVFIRHSEAGVAFVKQWQLVLVEADRDQQQFSLGSVVQWGMKEGTRIRILPVQHFPSACLFFPATGQLQVRGSEDEHPSCGGAHTGFREARAQGKAGAVIVRSFQSSTVQQTISLYQKKGLWRMPGPPLSLAEVVENFIGPERLVIMVTIDHGFEDFLLNWYISLSRVNHSSNILIISEDVVTYRFCMRLWPSQTAYLHRADELPDEGAGTGFGSNYYNSLINRRPEYIVQLLDLNCTVLTNDADMVWLQNPMKWLDADFDIIFFEDGVVIDGFEQRFPMGQVAPLTAFREEQQLCGCLIRVRPTEAAKGLMLRWRDQLAAATDKRTYDQVILNQMLSTMDLSTVRMGVLPIQFFPSGCLYFGQHSLCRGVQRKYVENYNHGKVNPVIVHANYMVGREAKKRSLQEYKMWFVEDAFHEKALTTVEYTTKSKG